MTGNLSGGGVYNVTYTGNSKTTGTELSGSALNNVTVNLTSGQTLTLDANRTPDGNLTITSGIFDLGANTFNRSAAGGTLTVSDGTTLKIGGTNTLPTNYNTHSIGATSTIEYAGSAQSVAALNSSQTYGNLTLSGSGTKTFGGARTVQNTLSIASGVVANLGTFTHTAKILTLGGVLQPTGSHGSTSSPAIYQNNTYFAATSGIINVSNAQTFSSSGTFTVPAGVTSITVQAWGGGGRGGSRTFGSPDNTGFGGGGGGGYSRSVIGVTSGATYTVTVGAGSTSNATPGGDSWFDNNTVLLARGGSTVANNTTTGANGGAAGIGDVTRTGGKGANGGSANPGGGGGSSAGTDNNGSDGSGINGGVAPAGGGNGGNGGAINSNSTNGTAGNTPGGGGGGAYRGTNNTTSGGNGATTPDVTGLSAGVYTVTVIDTIGGCTRVDTAVVGAGAKIILTVGAGEGCQGEIISIPVTAANFFDVTGFKFTVHVNEDTVGTILGVTSGSIHPDIADGFGSNVLTGNNVGITWSDTSLTLPNGTVLFNIDIQLGLAVVGSTSEVSITGTPVPIVFTQDSSGVNVVTSMIVIENDSIYITCEQADNIEIGGDIQTWNNPKPVPGVKVTLTGSVSAMQTTDATGTYLFAVPNNSNTTVKCFKETAGLDGITGADILLIKRHVLGLQPLVSPYQFVAADVSGEGNLSILDYSRIQLVALGLEQHIPGSPDWKFVPKSYVFPVPPLSVPFPDSISHLPATMSFLDDDFVAVRMGDVNGNIMPTFTGDDVDDRSETLHIRLDEREYRAGETIAMPFKANDFTQRSGFQMTLRFDPSALQLENIEPGVVPDMSAANFGTMRVADGLLTMLWVTPVPLTLANGEVFFTLKFKALRDGASLAEVLRPASDITRAEGYDRNGNIMKIGFEFVQSQTGDEVAIFDLYQNQPNPFNKTTVIGFRLPEPCEAQLRIFDVSGKMLAERKAQYPAGLQTELFNLEGTSGVLYYELVTPFGALTRKMVAAE